jgi:peptidoglycan/LPS O-acetylase OafA/YrhL
MSRPQDSRLPYMPGIDALRAIAVLAVFFYHAGVGWMPGGFLGVDVFFVISGYLITSLLLSEYRRGGHIQVGKFWLRRARRLLPAVGVFIAVTMIVAAIVEPDRIDALRGDALSSLLYVANWHFIFSHQSYFEQFQRPSLFRHLWSLSVEEQFYLLWPLAFAAGMSLLGRKRLIVGVIAGALGSVALAWVLFHPGMDASRVYYGTDTHAVGLLAGVALALAWSPWGLRRGTPGRWSGPLLDAAGVVALGYIVLSFLHVHDYDLALYHGGYLLLAIFTALLLAVLAHPAARLGSLIARPPTIWLGLRSYSFYLWHWPVLALTRPGIDVSLPRGVLIPLQLVAVLALADLSYRFVELPFRGKSKLPVLPNDWLRFGRPALFVAVPAVVLLVGWSGIVGSGDQHLQPDGAAASTAEFAQVTVKESGRLHPVSRHSGSGGGTPAAPARPPRIVAFGDSVMVGAKEQRQGGAPGGRSHRPLPPAEGRRPPPRRPDHPDRQQRSALQRRDGRPAHRHLRGRPHLPDQRPRAGQLGGRVQRPPRPGGEGMAAHIADRLEHGGQVPRQPHLGRDPPDPRRCGRVRAACRWRRA